MVAGPVPVPARPDRPRGAGPGLRDELVAAGVRVLAAQGDTDRLSIRAVAAEAGVTPPAVYRHFPERRVLIGAVLSSCFEQFEAHLLEAERGVPDPFEALRR